MRSRFLGPDPLEQQVEQMLARLAQHQPPREIETAQVDVKEEPGRRDRRSSVVAGGTTNEKAALYLAREMACMANTPGGGAIILGVADDGTRIGTHLDPGQLRHRIFELTDRRLTVTIRRTNLEDTPLLVLTAAEAIEPIRFEGRIRWRVGSNCVEIDSTTWYDRHIHVRRIDWSAMPSGHTLSDIDPIAVLTAKNYLREFGRNDTHLADASNTDLIRRLGLTDHDGQLTNAGSLLFVSTPDVGIDYMRREVPGSDSTNRVRGSKALLIQIAEVERACEAANRIRHVDEGFVHRQLRAIPQRAVRESIVNGVTHRDWLSPQPTLVEHIGDRLIVTSPGGFIGDVSPTNIITHPPEPRYRSLAEAMAKLHLAERQGIGVDRMTVDMLAYGRPAPVFSEINGPYVRVSLDGGDPDKEVVRFVSGMPRIHQSNVEMMLTIEHLTRKGWADASSVAPTLQRSPTESVAALERVSAITSNGEPAITAVAGVPSNLKRAYRLSDHSRRLLGHRIRHLHGAAQRDDLILDWARRRGRVSSTEIADLCSISTTYAGKLLRGLATDGLLIASRSQRVGRGFHYLPSPDL